VISWLFFSRKCEPYFRNTIKPKVGKHENSRSITYCLQNHKINSRPNTLSNYKFLFGKFGQSYSGRDIDSILAERIIAFLADLTEGRKQNTNRSRYSTLSVFFNMIINILQPEMKNPDLSTTQRHLGKVFDHEVIKWVEIKMVTQDDEHSLNFLNTRFNYNSNQRL